MNKKYVSRRADFEYAEGYEKYVFSDGIEGVKSHLDVMLEVGELIESSGVRWDSKKKLRSAYQGVVGGQEITLEIVNEKKKELEEFHEMMLITDKLHETILQNVDSQLTEKYNILLNGITVNNGENKYYTGEYGYREKTITYYDDQTGEMVESTYQERYEISLDEYLDMNDTPASAIKDYYIDKVNMYRYQVLNNREMSIEEKQGIFKQSIGDIASSYYTGDLGEFVILDSTEDENRKKEYAKWKWLKDGVSWVMLAVSIAAAPFTGGLSLYAAGAAAAWMAGTNLYGVLTGYDFYTGERLTDGEKWIAFLTAIASVIPVVGRTGKVVNWMNKLESLNKTFALNAAKAVFALGDDVLDVASGFILGHETGDWKAGLMQGFFGAVSLSAHGAYAIFRKVSGLVDLMNMRAIKSSFDKIDDDQLKSIFKNAGKDIDVGKLRGILNKIDDPDIIKKIKNAIDNGDELPWSTDLLEFLGKNKSLDSVMLGSELLDSTQRKGNFGEILMDEYYKAKGYEKIDLRKDVIRELDDKIEKGIDAIYCKKDNAGNVVEYIIGEAKYGTSQLNNLVDGTRQMDNDWVTERLKDALGADSQDIKKITDLLENNDSSISKVVFRVDSDGLISEKILDADGYIKKVGS